MTESLPDVPPGIDTSKPSAARAYAEAPGPDGVETEREIAEMLSHFVSREVDKMENYAPQTR